MIYCFDLDGTLCSPSGGNYSKSKPFKDRIEKVNKLYDEGHTIIIDTARGSVTGKDHHTTTLRQLDRWRVKYHQLRTGQKIYADFYVDDHAIRDTEFF